MNARLPGLHAPVDAFRDHLGIPHVRAASIHDALFAQGFVHAHDRLWQMTLDRHRAEGRLSELLGPRALEFDVFARRMGLERTSRRDVASFDDETRGVLDAYIAGVNAFIGQMRSLPYEFTLLGIAPEPFEAWHPVGTLKVRHALMGSMDAKLWRGRLLQVLGPAGALAVGTSHGREDVTIVPPGATCVSEVPEDAFALGALAVETIADGSNNWVVSGERTASGLPLVAGDSHRALEVPNVYYQNHVACPAFDAIGFSMPGIPGMFHFAHNADVAWSITHAMADTQDLYVERFDESGRYAFRDEWRTPERRTEIVRVRGSSPVEFDVVETHHGPVVLGDPAAGAALALRWTATDRPNTTARTLLPMLRARTVTELDDVMRDWVDPCNSMVMADRTGAIAYLHRGRVPIRSRANGLTPVPGWTGTHEWTGDVAFSELPRLRDPEPGFVATANNRVAGPDYPHYLATDYSAPNRVRRVLDRLAVLDAATADDMASIHADDRSLPSRRIVEAVADLGPLTGRAEQARELLRAWDGRMDPTAAAPAVYGAIRDQLAEVLSEREPLCSVVADRFPEEPYPTKAQIRIRAAAPRLLASGDTTVLGGGDWDAVLTEAVERAVGALERTLGPDVDAWRWGRVHATHITHPLSADFPDAAGALDPSPVPCGGDGDTVWATASYEGVAVDHASVCRYVFDLADWDRSGWVVPLGSSGDPRSPHYTDQAGRWAEVGLYPMTYSWERVEAEAETRERLEPQSSR